MRGDPTVLGWSTTALYGVAAVAAVVAARREDRRLRVFWALGAAALLVLGVNKQLDLQTDLMRAGKGLATEAGLYPAHRAELMLAVGALAILGALAAIGAVAWLARGRWRIVWPAALGWVAISAFVALRAAAFHHLDELGLPWLRWAGVALLEIGGLALLIVGSRRRVQGSSQM